MRFIREYANEKKRRVLDNESLSDEDKKEILITINRAVRLHKYSMIPTDEAMREIANA